MALPIRQDGTRFIFDDGSEMTIQQYTRWLENGGHGELRKASEEAAAKEKAAKEKAASGKTGKGNRAADKGDDADVDKTSEEAAAKDKK